ncbi:glutathione S-transferase family protein [Novosphingobium colocasiae]|uniref:Thiol:disulfide oxidoreductase n=1 Tax=Novosphingobium colocasiae TaxID=1256513 RepID=A0A918PDP9_9SPHN|nr:glutathione S-transferase N-terminal domain-containing protein [Novosphingobium colocasiae]GGZ02169.1 thiol:disulfide oxidoreductase [Novosphingobium colocasiae]
MITLYYCPSPNVHKICIALEEMELPYALKPIDLSKNEHRDTSLLSGSSAGRLPVLADDEPADGGEPLVTFESGAILQYLGEKTGRFLPADLRGRQRVVEWLFWQMGGLGPIGGQHWHFRALADHFKNGADTTYSENRYRNMWRSMLTRMDGRLAEAEYLGGDYSIADMACFPWIEYMDPRTEYPGEFANVERWTTAVAARPAVQEGYRKAYAVDTGYERNEKGAAFYPMDGIGKYVVIV